jgi:hypothetical protein
VPDRRRIQPWIDPDEQHIQSLADHIADGAGARRGELLARRPPADFWFLATPAIRHACTMFLVQNTEFEDLTAFLTTDFEQEGTEVTEEFNETASVFSVASCL